jgi:hypothetical protein
MQRFFHFIQFEWFDYRFNFFDGLSLRCLAGRNVQPVASFYRPVCRVVMRRRLAGFKSPNSRDRRKIKKAAFLLA